MQERRNKGSHNAIVKGNSFNPFKPNELAYPYQLDQSISILRVVGCCFSFYIIYFGITDQKHKTVQ